MSEENGKSKYSNKVKNLLAEAIRRRDAELLEKVEGMRWAQEGVRYHYGAKDLTDEINAHNLAIDDVIKLIKGE